MNKKSWILTCLILILVMINTTACSVPTVQAPKAEKVLKLGSIVPLSGPAAQWGKEGEPLSDIYAEIVNSQGGIKVGDDYYKIKFFQADGPMFPPSADIAATRKLVYDEKVDAIVCYFGVSNSPMAAITNPAKIVFNQSTLYAGYYEPKKHPYCFFGYPTLEIFNAQPLAAMLALPQAKTLAYVGIKSGNADLEKTYEAANSQFHDKYGITVYRYYWPADTVDFTPYLNQMREKKVDVIYTGENINTAGLLKKQAYQMNYPVYVIMSGAIMDLDVIKGICGSAEAMENIGGDYSASYVLQKTTVAPYYLDLANKIKDIWKKKLNKEPNTGVISTGAQMIGQYLAAVQKAGTKDPDAVMKAIRGGTFDTFLGTYTYSGKETYGADVVCGYPTGVGIVKNGRIQYLNEFPINNIDTDVPIKK
jgi:branched-chain amino acid transport system substrate-binding protein